MTIESEQKVQAQPYIRRYYDSHPDEIEGVELSQTGIHAVTISYLVEVLKWRFHDQNVGVIDGVNLYYKNGVDEMPKVPDIMVIDGYAPVPTVEGRSYTIRKDRPDIAPPPRLIIEIASDETWERDLVVKPGSYERMGVSEYFVFDPSEPPIWNKDWRKQAGGSKRLIGWRLDNDKKYQRIPLENGRLWSAQTASWLAVEGLNIRLYDPQNQLRLTGEEAERLQKLIERGRADQAEAQLERAEAALETERLQLEKLKAKLREMGQNPDDLLK